MKTSHVVSFAALILVTSAVHAASTDPLYYSDQGALVLPTLKLGGQTYSVVLHRLGTTWDFRLDLQQVTALNLSNLGYTPAALSDILGSWTPSIDPSSSATFNADGTYSMVQGPDPTDTDCPKGGPESGTYQYDATTGVINMIATSDSNTVNCGFSNANSVRRIKKVGTDIYLFGKDGGQNMEIKLIKR